jgi:hypothetical protein
MCESSKARGVGAVRRQERALLVGFLCAAAALACGNQRTTLLPDSGPADGGVSDGGPDAGPDAGGIDAGPTRPYRLASGGVQLLVDGGLGLQITPANLSDDVEVIEVHQEFYGLPWDTFLDGGAPPPEWTAKMQEIAGALGGKPVFLSVSMLNGERDSLAARTDIVAGTVQSQDHWAAHCYDFAFAPDGAAMRAAYLAYVAWMVDLFAPTYLNVAVEVNLFFEKCPAALAGLIAVSNAAYDAAKAQRPTMIVFPSIQIDHLYGYSQDSCPNQNDRAACFDALYQQITPLKRDRFALSTYPPLGAATKPADLPGDWFTRGAARGNERPLVAETGWNSSPLIAQLRNGTCYTVFTDTEADETAYLDQLLNAAQDAGMDLVNWWSNRDLVVAPFMTACPCTFDATWCTVLNIARGPPSDGGFDTQFFGELAFKAFGTMGIRDYQGNVKPTVYARWQEARAMPILQ